MARPNCSDVISPDETSIVHPHTTSFHLHNAECVQPKFFFVLTEAQSHGDQGGTETCAYSQLFRAVNDRLEANYSRRSTPCLSASVRDLFQGGSRYR